MSAYDQLHKAYTDAQRNKFWNAWGIAASPRTICELRAECLEHMSVHNTDVGELEKIFGLVVIPCDSIDDKTCYFVDEQLGQTILEHTDRGAKLKR